MFSRSVYLSHPWARMIATPIRHVQNGSGDLSIEGYPIEQNQKCYGEDSVMELLTEHDDGEAKGNEGDGELVHPCDWGFGGDKALERDVKD